MADLNRQLQEYLSQSKTGAKTVSQSSTSLTIEEEPAEVPGSWFGRWSSRFSRPGAPAGLSWPWAGEPDPCLPGLGRRERLVLFVVCALLSALCFGLSAVYAPLLLLKARKFALLWSLGSVFALLGAALLRGPSRLLGSPSPAAAVYLCALGGTLYAALGLHSTALTALGALLQVGALVAQVLAMVPGGSAGMRLVGGMAASVIKRTVTGKTMPI